MYIHKSLNLRTDLCKFIDYALNYYIIILYKITDCQRITIMWPFQLSIDNYSELMRCLVFLFKNSL